MATNSRIGIELPDETIKSVFCHWDGDQVGEDLVNEGFSSAEEVENFINEGDRSTVHETTRDESGADHSPIVQTFDEYLKNYEPYLYLYKKGHWYQINESRRNLQKLK